jgi:DnaK suppressor protein
MTRYTQQQLDNFRAKLLNEREQTRQEIIAQLHRADDPETLTLANHIIDGCDWTEADVLNDTDIALLRQKSGQLREIESALTRIENGSFGICSGCGMTIPAARMEVQLASEYCLDCQDTNEKRMGLSYTKFM